MPEDSTRWKTIVPVIEELKDRAKHLGLWNLFLSKCHYPQHGTDFTNLEYAVMAELLGRRGHMASEVVNCSAPNTSNMDVLAKYGTAEQQKQWLEPLLRGEIRSAFSMTERFIASSDATNIRTDFFVFRWISGAGDTHTRVHILMGKSDASNINTREQQSVVLVPADTPGVRVIRLMKVFGYDDAPERHCEIIYDNVRVPASNLVLWWGKGFEVCCFYTRRNAMAYVATDHPRPSRAWSHSPLHACHRCRFSCLGLDVTMSDRPCEEDLRQVPPQARLSHCWHRRSRAEIESSRLLVLSVALQIDNFTAKGTLQEIGIAKFFVPSMALGVIDRASQAYGAEGVCQDQHLAKSWAELRTMRIADGPDAVHLQQVGQRELRRAGEVVERATAIKKKEKEILEKAGLRSKSHSYR
ncbi:acyl-CoA dehydrogenase NM domain-like protein [Pleurotus eryngii]|uniref:Acyl-CoA dehydrogenase NM domain-like protein n=1 Tax=Pleurotus eryngii TaxID=5323 RepID=A0A9P6DBG6_PLEER|nr:acyl-CoA dehydrogenase NM domain-like protein [Pleurotus eryngii]